MNKIIECTGIDKPKTEAFNHWQELKIVKLSKNRRHLSLLFGRVSKSSLHEYISMITTEFITNHPNKRCN